MALIFVTVKMMANILLEDFNHIIEILRKFEKSKLHAIRVNQ